MLMNQGRVGQSKRGSVKASFKIKILCMAQESWCAVAGARRAICRLSLGLPHGREQCHYEIIEDLWPLRSHLWFIMYTLSLC